MNTRFHLEGLKTDVERSWGVFRDGPCTKFFCMELDQRIADLCQSLENCDPSELKHIQGKIAEAKRIRSNFNRTNVTQPLSDLLRNLK